jgi:drug/metabolite transporter (DMT)-like permease
LNTAVAAPARWRILAAFAAIYFLWGGSFVAIEFAIQTIPPFLMMGTRFIIAGTLLFVFARSRGAALPTRANWIAALKVGALLFVLNNGAIVWSQQYLNSGIVALLVAAMPMWMTLLDWLRPNGKRPTPPVFAGLLLGMVGMALLITPDEMRVGNLAIIAAFAVLVGAFAWAYGSLHSRSLGLPESPLMSTSMQLGTGGVMLVILGILTGEPARFDLFAVSVSSALGFLYQTFIASTIAFSCYTWLLTVVSPSRVATYAFVNPIVSIVLGALLLNEALTPRTLIAGAIIIIGVALIITQRGRAARPREATPRVEAEAAPMT